MGNGKEEQVQMKRRNVCIYNERGKGLEAIHQGKRSVTGPLHHPPNPI